MGRAIRVWPQPICVWLLFLTVSYAYFPWQSVWPNWSHTRKALVVQKGAWLAGLICAWAFTYVYGQKLDCYTFLRDTRILGGVAEWPYAYETHHMRMDKRCAKSSFSLMLMHLYYSLIDFLLNLQTCKHRQHYLKRVNQLIINKNLNRSCHDKIYNIKLKLLPKLKAIHLFQTFK